MNTPARTLFACWLAVVLTGTVVDHRHAAAPGHAHGYGWAAVSDSSPHDDAPLPHRHFVLLGVEFDAVPADTTQGEPADGTRPAAGELGSAECGSPRADLTPDADPGALFDGPTDFTTAGTSTVPASVTPFLPPPCPLVSHARSGVLRS